MGGSCPLSRRASLQRKDSTWPGRLLTVWPGHQGKVGWSEGRMKGRGQRGTMAKGVPSFPISACVYGLSPAAPAEFL